MIDPEVALTAWRFLHYALAMFLFGASAYVAMLVPTKLARDIERRFRSVIVIVAVTTAVMTLLQLPLETAFIGDGWIDAVDPSALHDVLSATSFGWAWQVEGVAVLLLLASLVTARRRPRAIAVTSGLVLASVSLTGHAVMQAGWLGIAHRVNDALHVVCAGAWLGGLVPLVAVIAALGDSDHEPDAELALRRFSTAGLIVVPLIIASGIINTALVLGRWPTDWSSPYRSLLALKIVLAATMIGIATANRYQFVQRLAQHGPAGHRALRTGAVVEIVLGLCVVALVSVFGMLDPNDIS